MKNLDGKVAVVTGAASGIGAAITDRLLREGVRVVLADIEKPALESAVARCREQGGDVLGVVTDVSDYAAVQHLAEASFDHYGAVHILVNNAGVVTAEAPELWDISLNTWTWYMNVHFWGVLHAIKAFLPRLVAQGGEASVMNVVAYPGALFNTPLLPAYSASRAAVASVTENLHLQLRRMNSPVRAHILFPGPNTVPTNTYTASRNRPPELAPEPHEPVGAFSTLEEMQAWCLETYGFERPVTAAEDVAEQAVAGLIRGDYWILPLSELHEQAVRQRHEGMLARRDPELLFEMS